MPEYLSVGALARQLKEPPWRVSTAVYRYFGDDCPLVDNRRQIPKALVPRIKERLRGAKHE